MPAAPAPPVATSRSTRSGSSARRSNARASAPFVSIDAETSRRPASAPQDVDPLRSALVGFTIAVAPGEAYYFPLAHHARSRADEAQVGLGFDDLLGDAVGQVDGASGKRPRTRKKIAEPTSIAGRALAQRGGPAVKNLPPLDSPELAPLRAFLEDPAVNKTAQNAKYDDPALRVAGVTLRGLDFDTMVASYVLDPGRRSHGLDLLALEFLDRKTTSLEELCGKGEGVDPVR